MMLKQALGISLLCLTAPAMAGELSYDYAQLGYEKVSFDGNLFGRINIDGDGFGASGSFEVGDNWFFGVGYSNLDFDFNVDLEQWYIGGGWHTDIAPNVDVFASVAYVSAEVSASGFSSADENGVGISVGVRGMFADKWELGGSLGYVDLGNAGDGTSIGGWVFYSFSDAFAAGFTIETDDDTIGYGVGGRYYFGN